MINRDQFLETAISKFTRFGCKRFTLDDLAHEMGVSKKTIYENFSNKETVVTDSLNFLLKKIDLEFIQIIEKHEANPILSIIEIYRTGFIYLKSFSPAYINGLKKYYPKSYKIYFNFRKHIINNHVKKLLLKAEKKEHLKANININLICDLYLSRIENMLFGSGNLFEIYSVEEILEHLIINHLRGISANYYFNN